MRRGETRSDGPPKEAKTIRKARALGKECCGAANWSRGAGAKTQNARGFHPGRFADLSFERERMKAYRLRTPVTVSEACEEFSWDTAPATASRWQGEAATAFLT